MEVFKLASWYGLLLYILHVVIFLWTHILYYYLHTTLILVIIIFFYIILSLSFYIICFVCMKESLWNVLLIVDCLWPMFINVVGSVCFNMSYDFFPTLFRTCSNCRFKLRKSRQWDRTHSGGKRSSQQWGGKNERGLAEILLWCH